MFASMAPRSKSHGLPCFDLKQFLPQYNANTESRVFFRSPTDDGGSITMVLNKKGEWMLFITPPNQPTFACPLSNGTLEKPDGNKAPSSDT